MTLSTQSFEDVSNHCVPPMMVAQMGLHAFGSQAMVTKVHKVGNSEANVVASAEEYWNPIPATSWLDSSSVGNTHSQ